MTYSGLRNIQGTQIQCSNVRGFQTCILYCKRVCCIFWWRFSAKWRFVRILVWICMQIHFTLIDYGPLPTSNLIVLLWVPCCWPGTYGNNVPPNLTSLPDPPLWPPFLPPSPTRWCDRSPYGTLAWPWTLQICWYCGVQLEMDTLFWRPKWAVCPSILVSILLTLRDYAGEGLIPGALSRKFTRCWLICLHSPWFNVYVL